MRRKKNSKIKNATLTKVGKQEFKSRLEAFTKQELLKARIPHQYENIKFTLSEGFKFNDETIRPITYKPDFTPPGTNWQVFSWIIECKGFATDSFKIKWKLFKKLLNDHHVNIKLYLPRNQKDVREVIADIKTRQSNKPKPVSLCKMSEQVAKQKVK